MGRRWEDDGLSMGPDSNEIKDIKDIKDKNSSATREAPARGTTREIAPAREDEACAGFDTLLLQKADELGIASGTLEKISYHLESIGAREWEYIEFILGRMEVFRIRNPAGYFINAILNDDFLAAWEEDQRNGRPPPARVKEIETVPKEDLDKARKGAVEALKSGIAAKQPAPLTTEEKASRAEVLQAQAERLFDTDAEAVKKSEKDDDDIPF